MRDAEMDPLEVATCRGHRVGTPQKTPPCGGWVVSGFGVSSRGGNGRMDRGPDGAPGLWGPAEAQRAPFNKGCPSIVIDFRRKSLNEGALRASPASSSPSR